MRIDFMILLQSTRLESGAPIMNVHTEQSWYPFFYEHSLPGSRTYRTSKQGELSRAGRTRAESHLKRIPKRTRAPVHRIASHRLQRYKLAPFAGAHLGCVMRSLPHTPDTNRYVAGLPSFQSCPARSPIACEAVADGRCVNKPFSARNASSHPAESGIERI